jgi:MEMO1 family protein
MIRQPAVAGTFYPRESRELLARMRQFLAEGRAERSEDSATRSAVASSAPMSGAIARDALACLVPHAGYVYSGAVAGAVYARIDIPKRVIILGPRHRPGGANFAINCEGAWETPLGRAPIDTELARALMAACPLLMEDDVAHRREHSLEVQLPFLQALSKEFQFVPIAIGTLKFDELAELGHALSRVIKNSDERVLLVASSDLNHYESEKITHVKDRQAIDQMLALNPRGLHETVRREGITMCGCGPAVSALTAALDMGATRAELVRYATSADVLGDHDEVVGYAGMLFHNLPHNS